MLDFLSLLKQYSIHPCFVFPGIVETGISWKEGEIKFKEKEAKERKKQFQEKDKAQGLCSLIFILDNAFDYFIVLKSILLKNRIPFLVSAGNPFATLFYLQSHQIIHGIYSSCECLLFVNDKIILTFESDKVKCDLFSLNLFLK